jgi:hypothetical protein
MIVPRIRDVKVIEREDGLWTEAKETCEECGSQRICYVITPQDYEDSYGFFCKACAKRKGLL